LAHALKCDTIDIDETSLTIQVSGSSEKLDSVINVFQGYTVLELVRTGKVLMARGSEKTA
jgi:acetolactate synthase-1/3 small subunit